LVDIGSKPKTLKEKMAEEDYDDVTPLSIYYQNVLHSIAGWPEFVDKKYLPDETITLTLNGIANMHWNIEDLSLNQAVHIMGHSLKGIYETYERKYNFSEPVLKYCPTSSQLTLTVGLYEKPKSRTYEVRP
jgi:hypothetical protein